MTEPTIRITSIAQLAALQGVDIMLAATSVGLDPILIQRVDNGRQGFPKSYAPNLAAVLGVDAPTLLAAARLVLDDSAYPQSMASVASRPLPPDPLRGETFPTCLTNATRDRSMTMAPSRTVWCVGQDVGSVGSKGGFGRIDRNTANVQAPIATTNVHNPQTLTRGIDALYTVGQIPEVGYPKLASVSTGGTMLFEVDVVTMQQTYGVTYEPTMQQLWVSVVSGVMIYDALTGDYVDTLIVTDGVDVFEPAGKVAVNGKMYVCGALDQGGGSWIGRLFEVHPGTLVIDRVSDGVSLGTCVDVAFDGVDTLYVVSSAVYDVGLYRVPLSSFFGAALPLTSGALTDPWWVICAFGNVFVSELDTVPKLARITPSGDAVFLAFTGSDYLGKPGFDQLLLWVPNPNDGTVSMVNPETMTVVTSAFVDGEPWAAVVV